MDKLAFGAVVAGAGLHTLPRRLLCSGGPEVDFPPPYIVKPRFGGSSIGIEVVADLGAALTLLQSSVHLSQGGVVEPYRADLFDLQIAVRSWPELQLSAIERPIRSGRTDESGILGYRDKYAGGAGMVSAPRELPAQVPSELERAINDATTRIASLCSIQGVARVDFLSDGSNLWVNEVNTIPGSLAHHLWVHPPLDFIDLLRDLLFEVQMSQPKYSSIGADGTILSAASSIASKLA
jgi:D-alanine-D-alanine ligase